jgi:hypothetical protein
MPVQDGLCSMTRILRVHPARDLYEASCRQEYANATAASAAAREAAESAAQEKARLLTELRQAREALDAASAASDRAGNARDDVARQLAMQLKVKLHALPGLGNI